MTSALRNGEKSYISPHILDRCGLRAIGTNRQVSIELRWKIEVKDRARSYRVPNCSFRVRDGLETDLAIGSRVLEQLEKQAGSTEESWNPNESTDDEGMACSSSNSRSSRLTYIKPVEMVLGGLFPAMPRCRVMPDPVP